MQIGQSQAPVCQGGNLQPKVLFVDARNLLQPHQFGVTGVVFHERGVKSGLYFGVFSVQNCLLIQELASDFGASVLKKCDGLIAAIYEITTENIFIPLTTVLVCLSCVRSPRWLRSNLL